MTQVTNHLLGHFVSSSVPLLNRRIVGVLHRNKPFRVFMMVWLRRTYGYDIVVLPNDLPCSLCLATVWITTCKLGINITTTIQGCNTRDQGAYLIFSILYAVSSSCG